MGGGLKVRGIISESGYIAQVNQSGQLSVDAVVNVGAVSVGVSGETLRIEAQDISGVALPLQVTQPTNIISGTYNKLVVAFSGDTTIAKISGETVSIAGGVSVSGNVVIAKTSGETHIAKISGETVITSISGQFVNTNIDLSGVSINVDNIVVDISGQVVVAKMSGETIRHGVSGFSYVHLQAIDLSGGTFRDIAVDVSGGNSLRIAGSFSASISGQPVNVTSGQVQVMSGILIAKVSGETVVTKVSGETMRHSFLEVSGTFVNPYVTQSGKGISGIPHRIVVAFSGDSVNVVSGQVQVTSGIVVAKISGETITAAITVSGNTPIASLSTISGVAMMTVEPTKTLFIAYQTLVITGASGGVALLSGDSRVVSVKNIGQSGTVMFIGSSGTSRAPWIATEFSGWGYQLKDGDSISIPVFNPAVIRVVALNSGQPVSYAINNY